MSAWAQPSLVEALSNARAAGCDGSRGTPAPLREVSALSEAARRMAMAQGTTLQQATEEADYRANRSLHISLSGYASMPAVVDVVRSRYCQALIDPGFTEIGIHRQGQSTWIILADPFDPPRLQQARAVSERVLALVNQARAKPRPCGDRRFGAAPPLTLDAALHRAAEAHAHDMASQSFMAHRGSDGRTVGQRVSRAGYDWRTVAENVASGPQTAQSVVEGWLNSPGHCANIMNRALTQMGVAYAINEQSEGGIYWAQVFGRPQ